MSCGVACTGGSDPVLLWLWHRPAHTALIRHLAWEITYTTVVALKSKNECHYQGTHETNYIRISGVKTQLSVFSFFPDKLNKTHG